MSGPSPARAPVSFSVRAAGPEDAPAIHRVHEASILGLGIAAYALAEVVSWIGVLTDEGYVAAMAGGEAFWVTETEGAGVVGFSGQLGDEVKAVYIAPGYERRGIGTRLLSLAEDAVRAQGHARVRIGASLTGQPFYEAHGYRIVERKLRTTRGGLEIPALDMIRDLPPDC
ncbi:MAG: GNAT family N-acetyltransferase [Alphaproteobacteria bacterium]|nr:GNAT family N-acetyltransferase [Alphaproteobacteria bacterium]